MKLTNFQSYLWITLLSAIVCSALAAHIGIPFVAILIGFVLSLAGVRFFGKKLWNNADQLSNTKKWILSILASLIGSQMGWVALLI